MAIALHTNLYLHRESLVHRWAVRPKLISLLTLMFAIALVRHLVLIPWVLAVVAALYGCSRLPLRYLLHRLPYPGLFVVAMVSVLPWVSGSTVIWQWHWLALRLEGIQTAALIAGRFLAIVITGFTLLGTTPFLDILKALRSLGLPPLLTDMTLLTYRYLADIAAQLFTMQQAMRLRGFGVLKQTLRQRWVRLGALFGSLLLRSYERSHRVYDAMRLRGYGHSSTKIVHATIARPPFHSITRLATTLTLMAAFSLVFGEWMLSRL
ncbi:MAG: cobalt ECF transporter T component CbiQ [Cyanobacteria bacterium J06626_18]